MLKHSSFIAALFCLNLFVIVFWFSSFDGYFYYDDITYARYAHSLTEGRFEPAGDHFGHRIGLIFPLALIYKIFGVSPYSTVLLPLLSVLLLINSIALAAYRSRSLSVGLLSVAFTGFNFYLLFFTKYMYPDALLALGVWAAYFALFKGRQGQKVWLWASVATSALFWSFLVKETAVLAVFFPFLLFVYDIYRRQHALFWRWILLFSALVFVSYLGYYHYKYENWLYRFELLVTLNDLHNLPAYNYASQDSTKLLARLTYEPWLMLINSKLAVPIIFTLAGIARPHFFESKRPAFFWQAAACSVLFVFCFISTSLVEYNPLALFPRHILMIVPLFAIAAAYYLAEANKKYFFTLSALLFICGLTAYFTNGGKVVYIYGALALWSLIMTFPFKRKVYRLALFVLIPVLMLHPLYHSVKGESKGFFETQRLVENHLKEGESVVISDQMQAYGLEIFYEFEADHITSLNFSELDELSSYSQSTIFLLWNPYHNRYLKNKQEKVFKQLKASGFDCELIDQKGGVTLYQLEKYFSEVTLIEE